MGVRVEQYCYLQRSSRFGWSLANLVTLLRMNLFTHRDLMAWLDKPFATPPDPQDPPKPSWPSRGLLKELHSFSTETVGGDKHDSARLRRSGSSGT